VHLLNLFNTPIIRKLFLKIFTLLLIPLPFTLLILVYTLNFKCVLKYLLFMHAVNLLNTLAIDIQIKLLKFLVTELHFVVVSHQNF